MYEQKKWKTEKRIAKLAKSPKYLILLNTKTKQKH